MGIKGKYFPVWAKTLNLRVFCGKKLENPDRGDRMAIEIGNNWPLMPITHPKQNTLQEKLAAGPPSQNLQDPVMRAERIEPETTTFWEKGAFIDFYIWFRPPFSLILQILIPPSPIPSPSGINHRLTKSFSDFFGPPVVAVMISNWNMVPMGTHRDCSAVSISYLFLAGILRFRWIDEPLTGMWL